MTKMSRTNSLRKLIKTTLNSLKKAYGVKEVYYEQADDNAMYPHIVFSMRSIPLDTARKDYVINIDIWDRTTDATIIESIGDAVEDLFNTVNKPQTNILPTFFLESRKPIIDEDKNIKHRQITLQCENYETEE